ncbi:MAG: class I SAM-dependent methyltransferase [Opitutales bacterium]|nr:class I SAM-dependent methyltransferase [Opitutales bacterium]MCH8541614.1 class I SAM-dependent methyltransferase [Opitutales bacterium]
MNSPTNNVAEYWSRKNESKAFSEAVYWLANPVLQQRYQAQASAGRPYGHWIDYCAGEFLTPQAPLERLLSIGSGTGELERHLALKIAFKRMDGVDIAPRSIASAREQAKAKGLNNIHYFCRDIEKSGYPSESYDAVFFNMSLHHMFDVDAACQQAARALGPDGLLFANEYIGPNRFDFCLREREVLNGTFKLIPEKYRRSLSSEDQGKLIETIQLPDPEAVAQADPSESVQSAEILSALEQHFTILALNPTGGTLFQFLLNKIAGNFHAGDPDSLQILEMLIQIEDTLLRQKYIEPHFALIVAQPKRVSESG